MMKSTPLTIANNGAVYSVCKPFYLSTFEVELVTDDKDLALALAQDYPGAVVVVTSHRPLYKYIHLYDLDRLPRVSLQHSTAVSITDHARKELETDDGEV
jgi:hypothetical protein